jgi:deazaflavin-dependent oxidoreductase (nitroreductase family)
VDDDYAYLTTTGRVTGRPHEIEIWYELCGDTAWLLAGGRHGSDWVRNLTADPRCTLAIGRDGEPRPMTARFPDGEEEAAAREALVTKYQPRNDGDLAGWKAAALVVALDPAP